MCADDTDRCEATDRRELRRNRAQPVGGLCEDTAEGNGSMTVTNVHKDPSSLTMTFVAESGSDIDRVWRV
ncbi:hypothetical protein MINT15_34930 [Saccharomonospora viridis]|uniref:Uncharacterized protein n=1 Tax=Saccharomonospora viridis TaxID=1852 RepID=A0A837D9N5_9PSEU|nr:hypothetical protein MINT15_34930 [Saccharomonospora viridis]